MVEIHCDLPKICFNLVLSGEFLRKSLQSITSPCGPSMPGEAKKYFFKFNKA